MYSVLDASMLGLNHPLSVLAPLCAKYGISGLRVPDAALESEAAAGEAAGILKDNGLQWGLLPMPADFYASNLSDEDFDKALVELSRRAKLAEVLGARHAYNHIWSSGPLPFDAAFDWHVSRVSRVTEILADHGVSYGLEFLGPHELQHLHPHPFVHTLAGVLAVADAAGGKAGFVFDSFHWFCGTNADPDDLLYAAQHADRLVALHLNDGVSGLPYDEQRDLRRALPMTTGVIDAKKVLSAFTRAGAAAPYMIEPFEPARAELAALDADAAVRTVAAALRRCEA